MNQPQREFLIKHIERAHKKHDDALDGRKPKPPSLNNYLIAAILEGSFELKIGGRIAVVYPANGFGARARRGAD